MASILTAPPGGAAVEIGLADHEGFPEALQRPVPITTVPLAAGSLQRTGAIDYGRGSLRITNRKVLEGVACECYPLTRWLLHQLYT